jgi:KaiC/GvpD/RAD55 family RecA-like ATPase
VRELEEDEGKRRVRGLYIVKSRGMGHSSDVHKLVLSDEGMHIVPMGADATASPKQKQKGSERVVKTNMNQKRKRI